MERATAPDGSPVARVRVRLDRAAKHRVRSSRNTILVEIRSRRRHGVGAKRSCRESPTIAPVPPAIADGADAEGRRSRRARRSAPRRPQLRSVRFAKIDNGYSVTLAGNGPLVASKVEEAKDMPPRVLLDFHDVAAGSAPAVTNVKNDDIDRVRVATNSRDPLITRVVIDLARKIPYTVEQIGDDLRVLFNDAPSTRPPPRCTPAATAAPADRRARS